VNFQSPLRRHSSNPRAIQPLEDHHEQSSRDSDGHYRDESNPDGDGDPSGNRARTHIFSRKPLKMDAAPFPRPILLGTRSRRAAAAQPLTIEGYALLNFRQQKPGFKRADNNWFRTAGSEGTCRRTTRSFENGGPRAMGLASYEIIGNDAEWRVRHDGKAENVYETKEAAFEAAVIAASLALRQGHEVRVTAPARGLASGSRDN
jgi:hypothetical protein